MEMIIILNMIFYHHYQFLILNLQLHIIFIQLKASFVFV